MDSVNPIGTLYIIHLLCRTHCSPIYRIYPVSFVKRRTDWEQNGSERAFTLLKQ